MVSPGKKARSKRYPAKTITDSDDVDDQTLLTNTPSQAEYLLHSLDQVASGIGRYMNSDRIEIMCFKLDGAISKLNGKFWN